MVGDYFFVEFDRNFSAGSCQHRSNTPISLDLINQMLRATYLLANENGSYMTAVVPYLTKTSPLVPRKGFFRVLFEMTRRLIVDADSRCCVKGKV